MFEKIGRYAETVATSAGQSRRGFLGRLGQAALGVAGVVERCLSCRPRLELLFHRVVVDTFVRTVRSTQPTVDPQGVATRASSMRA